MRLLLRRMHASGRLLLPHKLVRRGEAIDGEMNAAAISKGAANDRGASAGSRLHANEVQQ